ncbi:MAG TPA: lytic transglycosylase domain-containing protein [Gemmatimonadaceae bacterium]|nr:lytic transglycosylase domain-containing protein [Gemmatimonadaceae bacterium]
MSRAKLLIAVCITVAALSAFVGMRERAAVRAATMATPVDFHRLEVRARPVVVMATTPSIDEIVDLILRDRPTAAELATKPPAIAGFPEGSDEAFVAGLLGRKSSDTDLIHRVAAAIVKEGRRRNIGSQLLVGVLLTENPWLDPKATSQVGARGLMQVMPFHAGKWGCGSADLFDVESNICHGVAVLADNLSHSKSLPQALWRYNGCVRGTNTPDCWKYPRAVFKRAEFPRN